MKKRALLFYLLVIPLLSGCSIFGTSYAHLEQLRIVQTLGVDGREQGVRLTLATAGEEENPCLSADGVTISAALSRAQSRSTEEALFCGHVRQLVLGERTELAPFLRFVGRSADLRLDTPLWLLRDCSAETLLSGTGSGSRGITEILSALETELEQRGDSRSFTAGHVLQSLEQRGSALVCLLDYTRAAEQGKKGPAQTAVLSGFAIVQDGQARAYLKAEELLGVNLLRNHLGVDQLTLRDLNNRSAVLEIRRGSSRLKPLWAEDGSLHGLDLTVKVEAALLEGDNRALGDEYLDDLVAKLEAAVSGQLRSLLRRAKLLQADYLELGPRVEAASPLAFQRLERPFSELLPELEISLTVQGSIQHEYDME